MVFLIPYEFIERVFGSFVAQNFNKITTVLFFGGLLFVLLTRKSNKANRNSAEEIKIKQIKHEPQEEKNYSAFNKNKWNANGWIYNEKTKLWEPPDYLSEQSRAKWKWDEKKQIWIDQEKVARLERYHEFRKSQGKGPSYEEWKAAREAEQQDKSTT